MSVKLRFVRVGKKNRPAFRLCAIESRKARDGQYLENLGFYDPLIADDAKKIRVDKERAEYWLSVGAQPSIRVLKFFQKLKVSGLIRAKPKSGKKRRGARAAAAAAAVAGAPAAGGSPAAASTKPSKKPKPPKKPKPGTE